MSMDSIEVSSELDETKSLLLDHGSLSPSIQRRTRSTSFKLERSFPESSLAFESLDFDIVENAIERKSKQKLTAHEHRMAIVAEWGMTLLIGVSVGIVAFLIDFGCAFLSELRFFLAEKTVTSYWIGLLTLISISGVFGVIATIFVSFVEPASGGSGIAEIKSYLNGVKVPRVIRFKTLICKAVGVVFSVGSGLCVGREGPMIHIGSAVAAGLCQGKSTSFPFIDVNVFRSFRTDKMKRDFISGGAAAGVAGAFGAPIAGVLFSMEEVASFWNQHLTWRNLFCTITTVAVSFTLMSGLKEGGTFGLFSEPQLVVLGNFDSQLNKGYSIYQFPIYALIGILGGLVGASFISLNKQVVLLRRKYIYKRSPIVWAIEAVLMTCLTAGVAYVLSMTEHLFTCVDIAYSTDNDLQRFNFHCPDGTFNDMSSLFYTPSEDAIKNLLHVNSGFSYQTLAVFFFTYYTLTVFTFGMSVPSGLFIPSLMMGSCMGRLIGQFAQYLLPDVVGIDAGTFALLGSAAVLGGVMRLTISLTVMLMEATSQVTYGLPIAFTLIVAKWVGDVFNESILEVAIEIKHIPLLPWETTFEMTCQSARTVMTKRVHVFREVVRVSSVYFTLTTTTHNGYPIVDSQNRLKGIIMRSQLVAIMLKKLFLEESEARDEKFYDKVSHDDFLDFYPRFPSIDSVKLSSQEMSLCIDLTPYMNAAPVTVYETATLPRTFSLFRLMGLRHLPVIDFNNHVVGLVTRKDLVFLPPAPPTVDPFQNTRDSLHKVPDFDFNVFEAKNPDFAESFRHQQTDEMRHEDESLYGYSCTYRFSDSNQISHELVVHL